MFSPVAALPAQAPTTGLVASAAAPPDPGARWETGMAWRPERCITAQAFDPCGIPGSLPDAPDDNVVFYLPPAFRVSNVCSTLSVAEDVARVTRQAEAATDHEVALELWAGALTQANPYDVNGVSQSNAYLTAGATAVTTPGTTPLAALGALEETTRAAALGQQVFMHVPIHLLGGVANSLRRVGNLLLTQQDSVVVADAAYTGDTMYGTGPVVVRLSPIQATTDAASTVDRTTNVRSIWAERVFAATFDPCVHYSATAGAA